MVPSCPLPTRRLTEEQRRLAADHDKLAGRMVRKVLGLDWRHSGFEDAEQEARVGLAVAAADYQPGPVPFLAFAARGIRQHLRRLARRNAVASFAPLADDDANACEGREADPSVDCCHASQIAAIWSASAALSERHQTVLRMRFAEGARLTEIGRALGVRKRRAAILLNNALARVRRILAARN
jgi:RNA polymerase sigma factor (sigma-70 family)